MPQKLSFDAQVSAFAKKTEERMRAVFQTSVQRVVEEMTRPVGDGGNMPVVTGFLRASLRVTIGNAAFATVGNPEKKITPFNGQAYDLVISTARIGDTISAVFIANYAQRIENGFSGQDASGGEHSRGGRHFVKLAAQRWPTIVRQACVELKTRI